MDSKNLVDWAFVRRANRRFKSANGALAHLRRLGRPPSSAALCLINYMSTLEVVLEVIATLTATMRGLNGRNASESVVFAIKEEWKSVIGPWIMFLLNVVVSAGDGPSTPQAVEVVNQTLTLIPSMMSFPQGSNTASAITQTSPHLFPLLVQVWCKVVDENHPAWGTWSSLLFDYAPPDRLKRRVPTHIETPPDDKDEVVGRLIVRHLQRESLRITTMSLEELNSFQTFVGCLPVAYFIGPRTALSLMSIRRLVVSLCSYILSQLLSERKSLSRATSKSPECLLVHDIATLLAGYLEPFIDEPVWVVEVMNAGFIKAIFKAYPCLFEAGRQRPVYLDQSLTYWLCKILDQISKFLIYSSVIHKFSRAERKIMAIEGAVGTLKWKSEDLMQRWAVASEKAMVFRTFRQSLKDDLGLLCGNHISCSLKSPSPCDRVQVQRNVRFLRCSACLTTTYCSYECRRMDWHQHRSICPRMQEAMRNGVPVFSDYEFRMLREFIDAYYIQHGPEIFSLFRTYITSLKSDGGKHEILDQCKTPFLFIDFNNPSIPNPKDCVRFLDTKTVFEILPIASPEWFSGIIRKWWTEVTEGNVLMIGCFPRTGNIPLLVERISRFPPPQGASDYAGADLD
ncbi:hypothetical protein PM082_000540 [Marasmius tenuissimus]|nr:hypothetical protein PM082_000540 [Marasmius tenuissimus]